MNILTPVFDSLTQFSYRKRYMFVMYSNVYARNHVKHERGCALNFYCDRARCRQFHVKGYRFGDLAALGRLLARFFTARAQKRLLLSFW